MAIAKHARGTLLYISYLCLLFGLASFSVSMVCNVIGACGMRCASSWFLLPLSEVNTFDVGDKGNICCYIGIYKRIQVYDANGHLLRGWFVSAHRNALIRQEDDQVYLTDMTGNHFVFDINGSIVSKDKGEDFLREAERKKAEKAPLLAEYRLRNTMWDSAIIRAAEPNDYRSIVTTPSYLWPIRLMMPASMIIAVGVLGRALAWKLKRTRDSGAVE